MNNNSKRKAETLAEIVASMAAFGVIMSGLCEFMAGQTNFIARTKHRDTLMYKMQELVSNNISGAILEHQDENHGLNILESNRNSWITPSIIKLEEEIASFDWDADKKILTVKDETFKETLDFSLSR